MQEQSDPKRSPSLLGTPFPRQEDVDYKSR